MSNILETRYAGKVMRSIWDRDAKYRGWRDVWIAGVEALYEMGMGPEADDVSDLKAKRDDIPYGRIKEIEEVTKHDVVAHARAYGEQSPSGGRFLHHGFTSDNLTSTAELIQTRIALHYIMLETAAVINYLGEQAIRHKDLPCVGYTHFQPAQPTTIGKRCAMWGQGFVEALETLRWRYDHMKWGGIRGATGTEESLMKIFRGDEGNVNKFQSIVAGKLGLNQMYPVIGQTPPRVGDYQIISALAEIGIAAKKMGGDIRALWHNKQVGELFEDGQSGSSAMAYKRNPNRSERMIGLSRVLINYASSVGQMAADQILERGLDDSSQRRIDVPDSFLCSDAILQLAMFVSKGLQVYPGSIGRLLKEHLGFSAAENIIVAATAQENQELTRPHIHEIITGHAQEVQEALLHDPDAENDFMERIVSDERLRLTASDIDDIVGDPRGYVGRASSQVDEWVADVVEPIRNNYPAALEIESEVKV